MTHDEYMAEWRERNKDKIKEYQKAYRIAHRDELRRKQKAWHERNKEKQRAYFRQYQAERRKKSKAPEYYDRYRRKGISKKEWLEKYGYPMGDLTGWEDWEGWT